MAETPNPTAEQSRVEGGTGQPAAAVPSPAFDDALAVDVPKTTFELDAVEDAAKNVTGKLGALGMSPGSREGLVPSDRSPGSRSTSRGGQSQGNTPLATLGVGRSTRSADMLEAGDRFEMASPRDKGGFESGGASWRAWVLFLLFSITALLNWSVTFAIGAAWNELGPRLYFYFSFTCLLVFQSWQGNKLAGLLEGTSTAVGMDCMPVVRNLLGVFSGWLGLAPAVLAYCMMRGGIDHVAFNINFNRLTCLGLLGVMVPQALLQFFVGVHEAWLDQSHANYSVLLAAAVIGNVASAAFTLVCWEVVSRNPGSTEIVWDATLSFCT